MPFGVSPVSPAAWPASRPTGFSLIEVVAAIGIFAVGVVAMLGLFASAARSARDRGDAEAAVAAATALGGRLRAEPFEAVAGCLQDAADVQAQGTDSAYDFTRDDRLFFANRPGDRMGRRADPEWNAGDAEKYFEFTLLRNEELSPRENDAMAPWLAFTLRVRWPAFLPGSGKVAPRTQSRMLFLPASVRR
ncbi:MAG TPA: prepilin-type N-terminal cleavage/methylation domain-containing protein [Opitutaceae bacterium]|nr:prepilin-type N-terminal cleavage/methylation domain-containing protein [Opitutaceae bacterium]